MLSDALVELSREVRVQTSIRDLLEHSQYLIWQGWIGGLSIGVLLAVLLWRLA